MATDSLIGYAVGTLTVPPPAADSLIGYAVGTLTVPPPAADSLIGYAVGVLTAPADPGIRVWDGAALVPGWPKTWDGTTWV